VDENRKDGVVQEVKFRDAEMAVAGNVVEHQSFTVIEKVGRVWHSRNMVILRRVTPVVADEPEALIYEIVQGMRNWLVEISARLIKALSQWVQMKAITSKALYGILNGMYNLAMLQCRDLLERYVQSCNAAMSRFT
jgi:hypothetical protein